jgi:alpha-galactosidase
MNLLLPLLLIFTTPCIVQSLNNGLGLTPPMGYSSWNDCASQVTEERIKNATLHLISTGLAAKGYIHVNVDEGWLLSRNKSTGELIEDRDKFPSGMKALGNWIHNQIVPGKGKIMKYGLYTSRGTCQCSTQQYHGPGSHGYESKDSAWFANVGVDYLKVDSCCGSQDHQTAFKDYSKWRDGLNSTGRDVYFSLCGWHMWYAPKGGSLGNSWRIAGDGTNWGALSNCININSQLQKYASPGAWNDPDLLQGTGIGSNDKATNPSGCFNGDNIPQARNWYQTELQSRAQFSMWSIMSAPLLISADVGQVSQFSLDTWGNVEVINISQTFHKGGPYQGQRLVGGNLSFGKAADGSWTGSGHNVWGKKLPKDDFALCFVSNEDIPTNITCDEECFSLLGVDTTITYTVRDVWKSSLLDKLLKAPLTFTVNNVPRHGGVSMYRFSPIAKQQQPQQIQQETIKIMRIDSCAAIGQQCNGTYFKPLPCCDQGATCNVTGRDGYSQCFTNNNKKI